MEYIFACLLHNYGEKGIKREEKEKGKKISICEKKRENVKDGVRRVKNTEERRKHVKASLQEKKIRRGRKEKR